MTLPPLREELLLRAGPRLHDGQPSWTLQDPARNRFFRLDWLTFEILSRWALRDPAEIARQVNLATTLQAGVADVDGVLTFLGANQLLHLAGANTSTAFAEQVDRGRASLWQWLVHNYLFFRVPLMRPERWLETLHRRIGFVFTPAFWWLTAAAAAAGIALAARQWETVSTTWSDLRSGYGAFGYFVVLLLVKVLHELGHGLTATHFGCRVPTMGVAFLVMTPVAYTDTNEAWNLADRGPRLWIGAAGVLAELALAAWATLAWGLLPDGFLRSAAFVFATTTWVKSILINASPIMRFDGYYLASDLLDLPNLHARSFALTRWRLREALFGLAEPPPEHFRPSLRRGLILFAGVIWMYRLVVFLGIAAFVYFFFFKALGIVLFCVEIGWFVALPIVRELGVWWKGRAKLVRAPRWPWFCAGLGLALGLAFVPLPHRVRLLGLSEPSVQFRVVAPEEARLVALCVRDGQRVARGEPLARLESPGLVFRLERAKARESAVRGELAAAEVDEGLRARVPTLRASLAAAMAARAEAEAAMARLSPAAPFAGVVRLADGDVAAGDWLARQELVATVVADDDAWQISGYVDERTLRLLEVGAAGRFYADGCFDRPKALTLVRVERDASRTLSQPMLSVPFGGDVPAKLVENELVAEKGVYRVFLALSEGREVAPDVRVRRGVVVIRSRSESLAGHAVRNGLSLLWREAGF